MLLFLEHDPVPFFKTAPAGHTQTSRVYHRELALPLEVNVAMSCFFKNLFLNYG